MRKNSTKQGRGLISTILVIVALVIVLGAFNVDVRNIVESAQVQKNLAFLWSIVTAVWENYLRPALVFVVDFVL